MSIYLEEEERTTPKKLSYMQRQRLEQLLEVKSKYRLTLRQYILKYFDDNAKVPSLDTLVRVFPQIEHPDLVLVHDIAELFLGGEIYGSSY